MNRSRARRGISVLRDPFTAKPFVLFYTTKRVGGGVVDFDAIKLLKFAASQRAERVVSNKEQILRWSLPTRIFAR
jgi:hypothetical protein